MKTNILLLLLISLSQVLWAQKLRFGSSVDPAGNLVKQDTLFKYAGADLPVSAKFSAASMISSDTLLVIVKDVNGVAGKFYMKRDKTKLNAFANMKLKGDGIYRVYVFHPLNKKTPLVSGRFYVTSNRLPTVAALKKEQYDLMVSQGKIKSQQQVAVVQKNTGTTTNTQKPTVVNTQKPNPVVKDDDDDLGLDIDMDKMESFSDDMKFDPDDLGGGDDDDLDFGPIDDGGSGGGGDDDDDIKDPDD